LSSSGELAPSPDPVHWWNFLAERRRAAVPAIAQAVQAVETVLAKYRSFDVLATYVAYQQYLSPDLCPPLPRDKQQDYVEFLSILALKHPCNVSGMTRLLDEDSELLHRRGQDIFRLTLDYYAGEDISSKGISRNPWLELRHHTIYHKMFIRNTPFGGFIIDNLRSLFSDPSLEHWMVTVLGFTVEQPIVLNHAITSLVMTKLNERVAFSRQQSARLRRAVKAYRRDPRSCLLKRGGAAGAGRERRK
jgi:hypothetical protein